MKYIDFKRYKFSTFIKKLNFSRANFLKINKLRISKRYRYVPIYFFCIVILTYIIYLAVPIFFKYDKSLIENTVCKNINIKCSIGSDIKYSFLPYPKIEFKDLKIKNLSDQNLTFGIIEDVVIKLSILDLLNKQKFNFTKIELQNAEFNFDLSKLKKYEEFLQKKFILKPIKLKKGVIKINNDKKKVASISVTTLKYKLSNNVDNLVLKGFFLNDKINFNFKNKRNDKNKQKTFLFKFLNTKLLAKVKLFNSEKNKKIDNGELLFKKDKNTIRATFDYKKNEIIFKHASLKNQFLNGKFDGTIKFSPFFDFNLNVDLSGLNFKRLYSFIIGLEEKNKNNFFKVSNKINGQLKLSTDKIYSSYDLINSFESSIRLINGNILIEKLLFSLGKLGAADLTGIIKNEKKFSHLKFENNIYIDNQKRFFGKFGVYNKKNLPSSLFISGNFDLKNLNMRFDEISDDQNFNKEDIAFIEKEFNSILLDDGYISFFDFIKLKEFVKLITDYTN